MEVEEKINVKLNLFEIEINKNDFLAIDGVINAGSFYEDKEIESDCIKVLDDRYEDASLVEIETILTNPIEDVVKSLVTRKTINLKGITRIVGYYSRVSNWNKSKVSELKDRHTGTYGF
ncbi:MAG: anaerobic ribonucleoside-triphosphate reductase [bacterium]|nr:anaerobic ribonucleoside-triphosphate reductase [bacterium]